MCTGLGGAHVHRLAILRDGLGGARALGVGDAILVNRRCDVRLGLGALYFTNHTNRPHETPSPSPKPAA